MYLKRLFLLALLFVLGLPLTGAPAKKAPVPYVPPMVVTFNFSNPRLDRGMIFYPGEEVKIKFSADNDKRNEAVGDYRLVLVDPYGNETVLEEKKSMVIPPRTQHKKEFTYTFDSLGKKYGVFKLKAQFICEPRPWFANVSIVFIKKPRELTEDQRTRSPWGLNTLASDTTFPLSMYEDFGMVWIRDYGFRYRWFKAARDNSSTPDYVHTWPWYSSQIHGYSKSKLKLLACMQDAMDYAYEGDVKKPLTKKTPDDQWLQEFRYFFGVFGKQAGAWQVDNEHPLGVVGDPERKKVYEAYTKAWAQLCRKMDVKGYIVENGRAGVSVASSLDCADSIKNGSFKEIDALAGHFYSGIPEISTANANTNYKGEQDSQLLFDTLKDFSIAAKADGSTTREAWVTEFGWDTLVGKPPVTHQEQSAYAQRGFLMGLYAGLGKMFWFFYKDDAKANVFFDGCGIYDPAKQAKPVLASMAHLFHTLYDFKIVGRFGPHPNVMGYIMEQNGKYVACVFKVNGKEESPKLKFDAGWVDMFGNPIAEGEKELDIGPYWKSDISKESAYFKTLPYDLAKGAGMASPGNYTTFSIETTGRMGEAAEGEYEMLMPGEWSCDKPKGTLSAAPGQKTVVDIKVRIPEALPKGDHRIIAKITDKSGEVKHLVYYFKSWNPISVDMLPLAGEEGKPTKFSFVSYNNSPATMDVVYRLKVPSSWKASPKEQKFTLKQGHGSAWKGSVKVDFDVTWSSKVADGERAYIEVVADNRIMERCNLPMPFMELNKVGEIKLDGDLSDWPVECKIDLSAVGIAGYPGGRWTENKIIAPNKLNGYLGWKEDGLYYAFEIEESGLKTNKPLSFGAQECVEIFVDASNDKKERPYSSTDHHFFAVPRLDLGDNSVYLGRWAHGEIAKGQEFADTGFAKKIGANSYVIEGKIPASAMPSLKLVSGVKFGMNFNLMNNRLEDGDKEEMFWPASIREDVRNKPHGWGTVFLK